MNKLIAAVIITAALSLPATAQNVIVTDVNYGAGNIVKETSGTGAPADICTGLLRYTQNNATDGQNVWQCVSGHMKQQGASTTSSPATSSTFGTVKLPGGQSSTTLSTVAITGSYNDLTNKPTAATTFVGAGGSHAGGLVPDPGATVHLNYVLREDGTWGVAYHDTTHNTFMQFLQATGGSDVLPTFTTGVPTLYLSAGALYIQYGTSGASQIARFSDIPTAMVASGSSHKGGTVPDPGSSAGSVKFLREDGTWNVPASGGTSSIPTLVQTLIANPGKSRWDTDGLYDQTFSTSSVTWIPDTDTTGFSGGQITTGTTVNTPVGWYSGQGLVSSNPNMTTIFGLDSATGVQAWVGMCLSSCISAFNNLNPSSAGTQMVAFRHFSGTDTNWTCYLSDGIGGSNTADSGVAVDTAKQQIFNLKYVAGVPEFFISQVRVCSGIAVTKLPATVANLQAMIGWQNTTITAVVGTMQMIQEMEY